MNNYYSDEKDIQELISLLKKHGVKKAVVSPGSTNISVSASLMFDSEIETFSAVDERSAAYMACGIAQETGEPVAISCTGATAARNYLSALTEAYYRKLPIVAITSSQHFGRVGQHIPQVTDRTNPLNDIVKKSVQIPVSHTDEDRWANNVKINTALLELSGKGGGPVHINIETTFSRVFDCKVLPDSRYIQRVYEHDQFPEIKQERIIIFVGNHMRFSQKLEERVESFCERYNAIVLCDHTSNYMGKYRVLGGVIEHQNRYYAQCRKADLVIHIGEVSGAYFSMKNIPVWRVNPDGEVRDTFRTLTHVFAMGEDDFFQKYNEKKEKIPNTYLAEWHEEEKKLHGLMPELPFSNAWLAQQTAAKLPQNSEIHFGILNSLRMWNLFEIPKGIYGYSNTGGFGIDGCVSSLIGASLMNKKKLYFGIFGDLATFYDLNSLGNRHIGSNIRIMVVNNGTGFEMRHRGNRGDVFQSEADVLFAAGGHFGNKSKVLLRHYSQDLGFEYLCANTKEEYLEILPHFISERHHEKPILFEIFIDIEDENKAYDITRNVVQNTTDTVKQAVKGVLGEKATKAAKKILGR